MAQINSLYRLFYFIPQDRSLSVFDLVDVFDQYLHTIRELRDNPAISGQVYPTWPEVLADVNAEALDEDLEFNPFHEIVASPYLTRLIEETEGVICDVPFLSKFKIFSPRHFPRDTSQLLLFGAKELDDLLSWYTSGVTDFFYSGTSSDPCTEDRKVSGTHGGYDFDLARIKAEFIVYKDTFSTLSDTTVPDIYKIMKKKKLFPHLREIIEIFLVFPVSNAECERVISAMNQIKTNQRKLLSSDNLNGNMRIALHARGKGRVFSAPGKEVKRFDKRLSHNQCLRAVKRFYTAYTNASGCQINRALRIPDHVVTSVYPPF